MSDSATDNHTNKLAQAAWSSIKPAGAATIHDDIVWRLDHAADGMEALALSLNEAAFRDSATDGNDKMAGLLWVFSRELRLLAALAEAGLQVKPEGARV